MATDSPPALKVALVHDWLVSPGGAEKVLLALHELFPEAPIYTAAYAPEKFPQFAGADIRTTWLDKIKLAKRKHQLFALPRAWAFRGLDLSAYDLVISSSSAESKFVRTGPNTTHICYCHTPIRYYWSDYDWYRAHPPFGSLNFLAKLVLPLLIPYLRRMDFAAAQRVTYFIANSKNVQARIKRYYERDSVVIYPPVDVDKFAVHREPGEYFLVFGRQVAYKRLDLVVEAFGTLGLPLMIAGEGEEVARLKPLAKPNIKFIGKVSDEAKADVFGKARALIFAAEEDFGIVNVEAMAAGRPVIAYAQGGALESVIEGVTGTFFYSQTAEALMSAIKKFEQMSFDPVTIRKHAEQFSVERFKTEIANFAEEKYREFRPPAP